MRRSWVLCIRSVDRDLVMIIHIVGVYDFLTQSLIIDVPAADAAHVGNNLYALDDAVCNEIRIQSAITDRPCCFIRSAVSAGAVSQAVFIPSP